MLDREGGEHKAIMKSFSKRRHDINMDAYTPIRRQTDLERLCRSTRIQPKDEFTTLDRVPQ